jgi:hypothetical protein
MPVNQPSSGTTNGCARRPRTSALTVCGLVLVPLLTGCGLMKGLLHDASAEEAALKGAGQVADHSFGSLSKTSTLELPNGYGHVVLPEVSAAQLHQQVLDTAKQILRRNKGVERKEQLAAACKAKDYYDNAVAASGIGNWDDAMYYVLRQIAANKQAEVRDLAQDLDREQGFGGVSRVAVFGLCEYAEG